jgi:N-acyl-L-homoserine lactone synthetase
LDWDLVWSEEFETDTIDLNNWNYQVEEAGRFNDEWQR